MRFAAELEKYRLTSGLLGSAPRSPWGMFIIPRSGGDLRIIACASVPGKGVYWEHVSVSLQHRCPNWAEMCMVKDLFWAEDEAAMQLHPPKVEYINRHPYTLHLWRSTLVEIPMPPAFLV